MIKDEDLQKVTDYSKGQKDAAYSVLGEIANILSDYSDDVRIVGGWVPFLLYPDKEHIGSIDVDVLLNQLKVNKAKSYENIKRIMIRNGYKKHPEKFFTFVKKVVIDDIGYNVDVDFLSGKYGGDEGNFSKHVDGIKTLPAAGGNFAFDFPSNDIKIEYRRPDGALDFGNIHVVSLVPYFVMKSAALGRGKPKDAYDIYFILNNYPGGVKKLAKEFLPYSDFPLIKEMCQKLGEKFASPNHAGPIDVVSFLDVEDSEEQSRIKQDAYQKVKYLIEQICN